MASVYTNDLRLEEIGSGEQSGTWGDTTNTNLELIAEGLSFGTEAITTNADTHASTVADGATDPARSMYIKYTGALDSDCTITIGPNSISRMHFIENATTDSGSSGPYNIIIKQGSGATVTISNGEVKAVYLDGAGSGAAVVDAFASLNVGALSTQTAGTDNVRIGEGAGDSIASGANNNVTIGKNAGTALTTGDNNTAVGYQALFTEDANGNSTALGYRALKTQNAGTESYNVAVGVDAGLSVTTGNENTFVGGLSGDGTDDGSSNTAVGYQSLSGNCGDANVAIGHSAGEVLTGNRNIIIGGIAGHASTSIDDCVIIGYNAAGNATTTGHDNVVIGQSAGANMTSANQTVAIGREALETLSTGNENTAVGYQAGEAVNTGFQNTFFGRKAGQAHTTGNSSTYVGYNAGNAVTTGSQNTLIGAYTGNSNNLDMRTTSNRIVISDGGANPLVHVGSTFIRVGVNQGFSNIADDSSGIFRSERDSQTSSADADDYKTSGFYRFDQNAGGLPASGKFFAMVIFGNSGNVTTQIAVELQATTSYVRSFNSAWSSWARLDT
tara:strand:+ start:514 stop:2184 length:1671 start_codon:yes stop_codon:yes gene_type:complete